MNEIWGCVEHLSLPYETVMSMPVHIRKFWIVKHNKKVEEEEKGGTDNQGAMTNALQMNAVAKSKQIYDKNVPKPDMIVR